MTTGNRPGVGHLTEQRPGEGCQLLKSQGASNQQTWKGKLRDHDAIEQTRENDCQASQAGLKQTKPKGGHQGEPRMAGSSNSHPKGLQA
jgi:hypothetical protein